MGQPFHTPVPVIDIFAGPGGLGEGFARYSHHQGTRVFAVRLSIEKDPAAHATLLLRSFFRQFPPDGTPDEYYELLRGRVSLEVLYNRFPKQAAIARREARLAELGVAPIEEVDQWICDARGDNRGWVLIGGPPCQAYSVVGRSRNRGIQGYALENDHRHRLYEEYLRIIAKHWPPVFIMENVQGLLSSEVNQERLFERIVRDLRDPGAGCAVEQTYTYKVLPLTKTDDSGDKAFAPKDYVVKCEMHGIPQKRHRVILLGVRNDLDGSNRKLLPFSSKTVCVREAISDLPRVRSGLSQEPDSDAGWLDAVSSAPLRDWRFDGLGRPVQPELLSAIASVCTARENRDLTRGGEFVACGGVGEGILQELREWCVDPKTGGVCNHSTRAHLVSDLHRYLFAAVFAQAKGRSPQLADFPEQLLPNHTNATLALKGTLFADRFRVQLSNKPATTVTSHISKDGHYFIHFDPHQCRSLTVREAARLQTFPDNYFFCGPRTAQYVQVGNAVPPLLARGIAEVVHGILVNGGMA